MKWKTEKATLRFRIYEIWQILKCFDWNFSLSRNSEIGRRESKINQVFFFCKLEAKRHHWLISNTRKYIFNTPSILNCHCDYTKLSHVNNIGI